MFYFAQIASHSKRTPTMHGRTLVGLIVAVLGVASLLVADSSAASASRSPSPAAPQICEQTDYIAYRECVHEARRHKRQLLATAAVLPADQQQNATAHTLHCQRLHFDCRIACADVEPCERRCPICPIGGVTVEEGPVVLPDLRTVVIEQGNGHEERFQVNIIDEL